MVNYTSLRSGTWGDTTMWWPNGIPYYGDLVVINAGHTVTLGVARACRSLIVAGMLSIDASPLYIEDHVNGYIAVNQTGAIETVGGTPPTPRLIRSQNLVPTYPWQLQIYRTASTDIRPFFMDYLECQGNYWSLGNEVYYLTFNYPAAGYSSDTTEWMDISPLTYDPRIEENQCEGRGGARVYWTGASAGALQLSGRLLWTNFRWQWMARMARDGYPVALVTNYVHMKRGYLEAPKFRPTPGSKYVDFSVVLVEDK
jgi:hypothetical protein